MTTWRAFCRSLLAAADNDVEKAERGIVFIDEIDKIAKKQQFQAVVMWQRRVCAAGTAEAAGGCRGGSAQVGANEQECHGAAGRL